MPAGAYTPVFEIYKGGENITANFLNRAIQIEVNLASGGGQSDSCTITVDDRDWLVAQPHIGDGIEVYLGYKEVGVSFMGTFMLDRVNNSFPPKQISVHGTSVDFSGSIKSSVMKNFEGKTVEEIMKGVLEKTGYSVQVDPSIGSQKVPYLNATTTPLAVIDQLARQFGGVFKANDKTIAMTKRDSGNTASGAPMQQIVVGPEFFAHVDVEHLNRGSFDKVTAKYRNTETNEDEDVTASTKSGGFVNGSGQSPGGDKDHRIKGTFPTKELAQAAADAKMQSLDDSLGQGEFELAQGDPWIRDSIRLIIRNTRSGINGAYMTDIVKHVYTKDGGLKTFIKTKPPNTGESSFDLNIEGTIMPGPGEVTGLYLPKDTPDNPAAQGSYAPGGA